jgi:hypothetical protein
MGLMVFLAFISLFTLYWVPIMMEDNEAAHMKEVEGQFSDLKRIVDTQITNDLRNETRTIHVRLGSDGVPMFERETPGQLTIRPYDQHFNVSFQDSSEDIFENSSGSLDLRAFNRFYIPQTIIYQNGGVLLHQQRGDVLKGEPNWIVEKHGNQVRLSLTLISLYHDSEDTLAGTATEQVTTRLWYTDRWVYTNLSGPNEQVKLSITSKYAVTWEGYYTSFLEDEGLVQGQDFNVTSSTDYLEITVDRVSQLSLNHGHIQTFIGRTMT